MDDRQLEARTQAIGLELIEAASAYRPGPSERMQDWLLTHAVADDRFRSRLLRYMDVLAALDYDASGREAKRLAREYFGDSFPDLPVALRWLLRVARNDQLPSRVVGESARRSAELFARRFITRPGRETVQATTALLAKHGRTPSFDLLGEAVLSHIEAESYIERYLALIEELSADPAAGIHTEGGIPALQVSLKLSSLTPHFAALDAAGTFERVRPALERIAGAARDAGVGLAVDMEQFDSRDLTWEIFTRVFARGEPLGDWPDAGVVLQAYLVEADRHAEAMAAFARARGTPFQVRLVKGAYWDYETITARANRWPSPVFTEKRATDAQFERVLATLVGAHPALRLAVASHNARAHARAEALAEAAALPPRTIEHQTLFRTAEGMSRALADLGWSTRDYVPVGELLPGMAYLVRRVLENSSQAGFLLQSRAGTPPEELLRPPPREPAPPTLPRTEDGFERASAARWFDAAFRARFEDALTATRARWGEHFALNAGGHPLPALETLEIRSPSHPAAEPVGTVELAGIEATHAAIEVARTGLEAWSGLGASGRARVLREAARLLEARAAEFTAWVVHEGGRDRADAWAEVDEAIDVLRYYAAQAERLFGALGERLAPRGVVAVIPPWNFPLAIPCGMTAGALAAGNTAVLKPAEQTPLVALHLVALLHEAGVPANALVGLPGRGEVAGRALTERPAVAMVAFTGSRAVGTNLHEALAAATTPEGRPRALVAEMGGKNPVLVFADADLDEAVSATLAAALGHANQKCSAASRVLVEAPIFEAFRDRLVEAARSLVIGPADAPSTQVNPVIDAEAAARLHEAAATARAECEVVLDLLDLHEAQGASHPLTLGPLIVQVSAERAPLTRTATEELFGPILVLVPFEDEATAYALANGTPYGLTAGVFSRSPGTIRRATRAIEAGTVYVNRTTTGARVGIEPFGGMRMSGTGPKAFGDDYLWAFTRRTDAPLDTAEESLAVHEGEAAPPTAPHAFEVERWPAPIEARIEVVERASILLGQGDPSEAASALFSATQAARRELARPQPTVPVAGQSIELWLDTPRGPAIARLRGPHAPAWLATALLAGNPVALFDSPALEATVEALHAAGVPTEVLSRGGGLEALLASAAKPEVAFAITDSGAALAAALHRRLGPTLEGQRGLKALISTLDGPQPGEDGFARRFAWPKTIAIRTLRHGADLAIE